jgi:hypothetical protein
MHFYVFLFHDLALGSSSSSLHVYSRRAPQKPMSALEGLTIANVMQAAARTFFYTLLYWLLLMQLKNKLLAKREKGKVRPTTLGGGNGQRANSSRSKHKPTTGKKMNIHLCGR